MRQPAIVRLPALLLFLLIIAGASHPQTFLRVVTLSGKVRDFIEYQNWDSDHRKASLGLLKGGHPDFQHFMGGGCQGAVERRINTGDITSVFPFDNRGPKMVGNGCYDGLAGTVDNAMNGMTPFTGSAYFRDWYNDTTVHDTILNRPFLVPLHFNFYSDCRMVFSDSIYFPLDSGKEHYSLSDPPQVPYGITQTYWPDHDYGFTLEFHCKFSFLQGTHQTFSFTGDDDVWVFVNDSLVIDLGGLHPMQTASVDLDALPTGFLKDAGTYMLDFFSAERHTQFSNIRITTTIVLENEGTAVDTTILCSGRPMALPPTPFPPAWYTAWNTPPISGHVMGADGLPVRGAVITLTFSNGGGTVQTNAQGYYTINLPRHWSGTVTPQAPNYVFTPVDTTITNLTGPLQLTITGTDTSVKSGVSAAALNAPRRFGITHEVTGGTVDFLVAVDKPRALVIAAYDVAGKRLWSYSAAQATPGYRRVTWRNPSPGLCFVRAEAGDIGLVRKVMIAR